MTSPEKLDKILALSRSPNENEASAAALMLCRRLTSENYSFLTVPSSSSVAELIFWKQKVSNRDAEIARLQMQIDLLSRLAAKPKSEPPSQVETWRRIEAKYSNRCDVCGKRIEVGDRIYWHTGTKKVVHDECHH